MKNKKNADAQLPQNLSFEFNEPAPPNSAQLPSVFTMTPFFRPTTERSKGDRVGFEDSDGESFKFENIEWIRFGPGLDSYDLETLIALMQLIGVSVKSSKNTIESIEHSLITGSKRNSPKSFKDIGLEEDLIVRGEREEKNKFGVVTAAAVNRYIGRAQSALALKGTRDSIHRISRNGSRFIDHSHGLKSASTTPFIHSVVNKSGAFVIRFPTEMNFLFNQLQDFNLRTCHKLSEVGKIMMLWMSHFEGEHQIKLTDALTRTNYAGSLKEYKRMLVTGRSKSPPVLPKMVEFGFLKHFEISGTGRKYPFILSFSR